MQRQTQSLEQRQQGVAATVASAGHSKEELVFLELAQKLDLVAYFAARFEVSEQVTAELSCCQAR